MKKLIQLCATILLLSGLISCQDKLQDDRLSLGDQTSNRKALLLQCNFVTLPSTINSNMTLSAANTYLINGVVEVTNNATLTIPAGTVLQGVKGNNSFLIIDRGASSSGSLQFVQIHFAGAGGGAGSDRLSESALILNSVGSGTTIDRVQISQSARDGMAAWGGTADLSRVFNHAVQRTDFMISYGYQGNGQYLAGFKQDATANTTNAFAFAMDISNDVFTPSTATPLTYPTVSNTTFLGGDFCNGDDSFEDAIVYRNNGNGRVYNSVISSFSQDALVLSGSGSINNTNGSPELQFSYNSFHSITNPGYSNNGSWTGCGIDMADWIEGTAGLGCEEANNQFSVTTLGLNSGEICITCPDFPDFTLGTNSLQSPNYTWDSGSEFDHPSFRGAFGSTPWVTSGWMDFCPQSTDYCI